MAHESQMQFIQLLSTAFPESFVQRKVLEIGSLDINGTIRSFFQECDYLGLDVAQGRGVDLVCQGQEYRGEDHAFDVVISCEAMEHNPYWKETFRNMVRLCRPGGLVIMTCASVGRPEHGTTRRLPQDSPLSVGIGWDYYRNLREADFLSMPGFGDDFAKHKFWVHWNHYDLLFMGIKKPLQGLDPAKGQAWAGFVSQVDAWIAGLDAQRVLRYRARVARLLGDRWFAVMHSIGNSLQWLHKPRC